MSYKFLSKKYWNMTNPLGDTVELEETLEDILNLSIGDPDLNTHIKIIEGAFEDAKKGYTHYTNPEGYADYIEKVIAYYKEEYSLHFNKDEVMASVGASHGIFLTLQCILDNGDEVILTNPGFPMYKNQVELAGGKSIFINTSENENFEINIDVLRKLITKKTKAIILNTPNNPTGVCYSKKSIEQIVKLSIEKDFMIISDEVYDTFSYEEPFKPVVSLGDIKERVITVGSFSKDFAMTGWRIGFVIAPNYIINCMKNLNENICFSASSVSQRAGIYALKYRKEFQANIVKEYRDRVLYAYNRINKIKGIHAVKPQGAIYVFVNIKNIGLSSNDFASRLLKEKQVQVISGTVFGSEGEGYLRIACTLPIDKLEIAFKKIQEFCNNNIK